MGRRFSRKHPRHSNTIHQNEQELCLDGTTPYFFHETVVMKLRTSRFFVRAKKNYSSSRRIIFLP